MTTWDAGSIEARLVLSRDDFTRGLDAARADADKFSGKDISVKVKADTKDADKSLGGTQAKADKLGKSSPTVKVNVDDAQTTAKIAQVQARIDRLNNIIARPQVSLEAQKAQAQLDALNAKLTELAGLDPTPKVEADTAAAQAKIDDLTARLDRLGTRDTEIKVKASADLLKAQADLAKLQQGMEAVGVAEEGATESSGTLSGAMEGLKSPMAALIGAGIALSPVLVTVGVGAAGFGAAALAAAKPIEAAATATGGLKANMAGLNPEQRQVAQGVLDLEGRFSSFSKALQPQVFSVFNSGLSIANTLLTDVQPVAKGVATGLGQVTSAAAHGLNSPEWKQFFDFMAQNAQPDVQLLGQAFGSLASALPPVLEDLQPVAVQLLEVATATGKVVQGAAQVSKAEERLASSSSHSSGVLGDLASAAKRSFLEMFPGVAAAGKLKSALDGVGDSSKKTADAQQRVAQVQQQAQPSTTNLAADVSVLASNEATAALQTTALTDAWNILVGNFASKETAILNAQSAVKQFGQTVQQQGAGSLAAKQAFESAVTSIGQMVEAEQKAHTPAAQMYTDLQNQIRALQASGPLNAEQTSQLNGMKRAADAVAQSTVGWTGATKNAASALEANMLPALSQMKANTPTVRTDVDNLTTSIINTGTKSSATHGARQQLIQDLENAGVNAKTARTWVSNLQTSINGLHGKTVAIHMNGQGLYTITGSAIAKSQGPGGSGNAAGGLATGGRITGPGGPTADKAGLYALSHDEWVIKASSSNRYGHAAMNAVNQGKAVIGYASGGQVGGGAVSGNLSGSYVTGMYSAFERQMQDAMVTSMKSAMKSAVAAATKAAASVAGNVNYKPSAGVEQWRGVVVHALSLAGASTSLANNVLHQMQTESGGNPRAVNLWDSNAKAGHPSAGLMQVIGPTYAAYGAPKMGYPAPVAYGVSEQPLANTYAGIKYAQSTYGPNLLNSRGGIGSGKGYADGTTGAAPGWALTGEKGRELVYYHGGETVLPHAATERVLAMHGAGTRGYAKGTSNAASLAGIISGAPGEGWSKDVSGLKSDLKIIATSLGIKGLSKADASKLKGEQGKDENELLVATAYLGKLQAAKKQITSVTEPQIRKQISALTGLSKIGKLSAAENRLLKTLKASLASQQAKLGRINVAISGKAAVKPKPAAGPADGSADAGGGGDAGGGDSGSASTTTSPTPVIGAANITLGTASAYGGSQFTLTPTSLPGTGTFSGVPAGSAHQLPDSQHSLANHLDSILGSTGGNGVGQQILASLKQLNAAHERLIAVTSAAPAATGGHIGAALNGSAQAGYFRARYPASGY